MLADSRKQLAQILVAVIHTSSYLRNEGLWDEENRSTGYLVLITDTNSSFYLHELFYNEIILTRISSCTWFGYNTSICLRRGGVKTIQGMYQSMYHQTQKTKWF